MDPGWICLLLSQFVFIGAVQWLSITQLEIATPMKAKAYPKPDRELLKVRGLHDRQIKLASSSPGILPTIRATASAVVAFCQVAFNDSRWNCSTLGESTDLSPELRTGTREQAYVYALTSSLLTFDISKACSAGKISSCKCADTPEDASHMGSHGDFQWGGCSINLKYGLRFSEQFTDAPYKKYKNRQAFQFLGSRESRTEEALMNLHNNRVGRRIVESSTTINCRCHGFSGSCTVKTCWKDLDERKLLAELKQKYLTADHFNFQRSAPPIQAKSNLEKRDVPENSLIFYTMSSDYCHPDTKRGSRGTSGRKCGDPNRNNCDWMCCGRGYKIHHYTQSERCNCKHIWCCYVKCDVCNKEINDYLCN